MTFALFNGDSESEGGAHDLVCVGSLDECKAAANALLLKSVVLYRPWTHIADMQTGKIVLDGRPAAPSFDWKTPDGA